MEKMARTEGDSRAEARLMSFLAAQGFKVQGKKGHGVRRCLKVFVSNLRSGYEVKEGVIPDAIQRILASADDEYTGKVLLNCNLSGINNLRSLYV
jgi:hypothetical protein